MNSVPSTRFLMLQSPLSTTDYRSDILHSVLTVRTFLAVEVSTHTHTQVATLYTSSEVAQCSDCENVSCCWSLHSHSHTGGYIVYIIRGCTVFWLWERFLLLKSPLTLTHRWLHCIHQRLHSVLTVRTFLAVAVSTLTHTQVAALYTSEAWLTVSALIVSHTSAVTVTPAFSFCFSDCLFTLSTL